MKFLKLLFLLFTVSCGPVYAQIQLGTNFQVNTALPIDSRMSVADLTARDAIPALVRWEGLITYVVAEGKHFALVGGITNGDWVELGSGGGGGSLKKWLPTTEYVVGETIWEEISLKIYVANTTHISAGTFAADIANWDELSNPFSATNLSITGNSLISTDLNGPVIIAPDGTGSVQIGGSGTITTEGTDQNLTLDANGTGIVDVNAPINLESIAPEQVPFGDSITGNLSGSASFLYDPSINSLRVGGFEFSPTTIQGLEIDTDVNIGADGAGQINLNNPLNVGGMNFDTNEIASSAALTLSSGANGNVNLDPNGTGDVTVTYGTNELSLDPSRHTGSLLRNPDFENEIVEFACTDATGAFVAATLDIPNNNRMFQMTVTDVGGYCDFVFNTDSRFVGLPFVVGALVQTELTDVDVCALVNGVEVGCSDVTAVADILTGAYHNPYAIQKNAGGTSVGVRIKTTSSTSGVINVDKLRLDLSSLPTGSAISCSGDLDCENVFSAKVNGTVTPSPVSNLTTPNWIENCTRTGTGLYDCPVNGFNVKPNCWGQRDRSDTSTNLGNVTYNYAGSTNTVLRFQTRITNDGVSNAFLFNMTFDVFCTKGEGDFKTIQQQGVVNTGTAQGALLVVNNESVTTNQTIGTSTTVIDFSDIEDARGISWDIATNTGTFLQAGRYGFYFTGQVSNATPQITEILLSVDTGSGFAPVAGQRISVSTSSSGSRNSFTAQFVHDVKSGDVFRIEALSTSGATILFNDVFSGKRNYPTLTVKSEIDQQSIVGSLAKNYVSGGAEFITPDTWDGKPIYRRCYEVLSDITTTTTIATIEPGLKPVEVIASEPNLFYLYYRVQAGTGTGFGAVTYNKSTGVLTATVSSPLGVYSGTRFCIRYTKP